MYLAVSITEDLLGRLRAGAQKAVLAPIVEPGEDWDGERRERFVRVATLLNAIGWRAGEGGSEVVIDIDEHALALCEVLVWALHDALAEQRQAEHEHEYASEWGERMCPFAALIDAASREHAHEDVRVRRLDDQAKALIGELEVEPATRPFADLFGLSGEQSTGCLPRLRGRFAGLPFLAGVTCRRTRGCRIA